MAKQRTKIEQENSEKFFNCLTQLQKGIDRKSTNTMNSIYTIQAMNTLQAMNAIHVMNAMKAMNPTNAINAINAKTTIQTDIETIIDNNKPEAEESARKAINICDIVNQ